MVELLGRNLQLTAVFAYNDNMAAGADGVKDNGIAIPLHLSVIGFDDIPIARYTDPQLTTVRYPIASMAKIATDRAGVTGGRRHAGYHGDALLYADHGTAPFGGMATECGTDH